LHFQLWTSRSAIHTLMAAQPDDMTGKVDRSLVSSAVRQGRSHLVPYHGGHETTVLRLPAIPKL
jgi:hypothetical protein